MNDAIYPGTMSDKEFSVLQLNEDWNAAKEGRDPETLPEREHPAVSAIKHFFRGVVNPDNTPSINRAKRMQTLSV